MRSEKYDDTNINSRSGLVSLRNQLVDDTCIKDSALKIKNKIRLQSIQIYAFIKLVFQPQVKKVITIYNYFLTIQKTQTALY